MALQKSGDVLCLLVGDADAGHGGHGLGGLQYQGARCTLYAGILPAIAAEAADAIRLMATFAKVSVECASRCRVRGRDDGDGQGLCIRPRHKLPVVCMARVTQAAEFHGPAPACGVVGGAGCYIGTAAARRLGDDSGYLVAIGWGAVEFDGLSLQEDVAGITQATGMHRSGAVVEGVVGIGGVACVGCEAVIAALRVGQQQVIGKTRGFAAAGFPLPDVGLVTVVIGVHSGDIGTRIVLEGVV